MQLPIKYFNRIKNLNIQQKHTGNGIIKVCLIN